MNYKLGIIGAGNMASAIVKGIIKSKIYDKSEIIISDISKERRKKIDNEFGIKTTAENDEVFGKSDVIIFAVKPQYFLSSIENINKQNLNNKLIISIMAGISIEKISKALMGDVQVVRIMPNTPALVNEAMSVICFAENVSDENKRLVVGIFDGIGKSKISEESKIDAVTAISGSSPAYIFIMIEAMADAGVLLGLSRDDAYFLASQTIMGSAKLFLETNTHPAKLKDMVCSPGGTTIEAVRVLEQKGFRSALIEAMIACDKKSKDMGKDEK
jgi:pyrroline-5-carboxylate reductase